MCNCESFVVCVETVLHFTEWSATISHAVTVLYISRHGVVILNSYCSEYKRKENGHKTQFCSFQAQKKSENSVFTCNLKKKSMSAFQATILISKATRSLINLSSLSSRMIIVHHICNICYPDNKSKHQTVATIKNKTSSLAFHQFQI